MPKRLFTFEVEYELPIDPPVSDRTFGESFIRAIEGLEGRTYSFVTVKRCQFVHKKGRSDA